MLTQMQHCVNTFVTEMRTDSLPLFYNRMNSA